MVKDEDFVDFAVNHYVNLWNIAMKTADIVMEGERFGADIFKSEVIEETFRMMSQPVVYLYQAFLHVRNVAEQRELTPEEKKVVDKAVKDVKGEE